MNNAFSRNVLLIGETGQSKISNAKILIVGIGGVGGYALENLVRAGVGHITAVDGDRVDESNLNRQILALRGNVGEFKVNVAENRAKAINPDIDFIGLNIRYNEETSSGIFDKDYDYCVDCFDSVKDKVHFIVTAKRKGVPIISAMGAGNRLNADFAVTDIYKTKYDRLAKAVRSRLKDEGISELKTVCSLVPLENENCDKISETKSGGINNISEIVGESVTKEKSPIASISYSPAIMGCMIAAEVIKDILKREVKG